MTVLQALNDHTRTMQLELPVRGKLLFMLEARQSMGKKKYGHSIDRDDLTREEWLQHLLEEMLDGEEAGFKKYGHTMDRKDYRPRDWRLELLAELLDAPQYAVAADEEELAIFLLKDAYQIQKKLDDRFYDTL